MHVFARSLLFIGCVFSVWIVAPEMPGDHLDPSWRHGINEAVARGFSFGRDIVFTFGPYGSLYTGIFHPATDGILLWSSLGLGLIFGFAVSRVAGASHWVLVLVLTLVLTSIVYLRDPLFFCYPLLAGLCCVQIFQAWESAPHSGSSGSRRFEWADIELALLFAPLGLLVLIKGSSIAQCGVLVFASAALFAFQRRWLQFVVVLAAPLISMAVLWLLADQPLAGLPRYFSTMASVTAGYSEAMASPGPSGEVFWFLGAAVSLLAIVMLQRQRSWVLRLYIMAVLGTALFVAFKAGFVRHDGHATIAGVSIVLFSLIIWASLRPKGILIVALLSVTAWHGIDQHYMHSSAQSLSNSLRATWTTPFVAGLRRLNEPGRLEHEYRSTLGRIKESSGLPVLPGTVDIYSYNQTQLLASGNTWHPRPVFQSYQAYSVDLLALNQAHISGDQAPRHIFFRIEPIDDRLPSTEDGASWPVLLARYVPHRLDTSTLTLDLDPVRSAHRTFTVRGESRHRLREDVSLPDESRPMMVELDVKPTWAGRLMSILYKPSPLLITLALDDGSRRTFRLISGLARGGFLLNPLVLDVNDYLALASSEEMPDARRVRSFSVTPQFGRWHWRKSFDVRFIQIER